MEKLKITPLDRPEDVIHPPIDIERLNKQYNEFRRLGISDRGLYGHRVAPNKQSPDFGM